MGLEDSATTQPEADGSDGPGEEFRLPSEFKRLMSGVWEENRYLLEHRLAVVEAAAEAAVKGLLAPEARARAASEAHTLAGSVGTFGFDEGSEIAGDIRAVFESPDEIDPDTARSLQDQAARLRKIIFD